MKEGCNNAFCRSLGEESLAILCRMCVCRSYPKGQLIMEEDFAHVMRILTNGLLVSRMDENEVLQEGGVPAFFLSTPNDLLNAQMLFHEKSMERIQGAYLECITPCRFACFPKQEFEKLFHEDSFFAQRVLQNCLHMLHQSCEYTMTMRGNDMVSAIVYLLKLLKKYHLPMLTHNQIAEVTGYSRPHVTKAMKVIYRDYTELVREIEESSR